MFGSAFRSGEELNFAVEREKFLVLSSKSIKFFVCGLILVLLTLFCFFGDVALDISVFLILVSHSLSFPFSNCLVKYLICRICNRSTYLDCMELT